jgi:hypothetical protein
MKACVAERNWCNLTKLPIASTILSCLTFGFVAAAVALSIHRHACDGLLVE